MIYLPRMYSPPQALAEYYLLISCCYLCKTRIAQKVVFLSMPLTRGKCLYCLEPIKSGRSDKKFCDSECKDAYYNAIKSQEQSEISKIDTILKRNRRILKKLFDPKKEEKMFKREILVKEGFEFGFHTHVAVTRSKSTEITFCYDYGYREIEEGRYRVFQSFSKVWVKDGYETRIAN